MDLGVSHTMLGFVVSVYGVVQLLTQIPIGRLSDQMGRKKILLLGLATPCLVASGRADRAPGWRRWMRMSEVRR